MQNKRRTLRDDSTSKCQISFRQYLFLREKNSDKFFLKAI